MELPVLSPFATSLFSKPSLKFSPSSLNPPIPLWTCCGWVSVCLDGVEGVLLLRLFPYCFSLPGQHGRRCTISACCPNPPRRRGRLRIGADCKDARRIEGRGKEASGGSLARTTGKRVRTKDDWGTGGLKTCDCLYRSDQSSGSALLRHGQALSRMRKASLPGSQATPSASSSWRVREQCSRT